MSRQLVVGDPVIPVAAPPIRGGGVIVADGVIEAVGPRAEMERRGPFAAILGSDDHLVLPGFINAHHHAGRTFRSGLRDAPFERRNVHLHLLVASGTEESLYRSTLYSCAELLRAGVTATAVIFYPNTALPAFGADAALEAYLDSGMRVGFAMAQRDRALYTHEDDETFLARLPPAMAARVRASPVGRYSARSLSNDEYFAAVRDLAKRWHGRDGRAYIHLGPDWFPSCTDELLKGSRRTARELGTQIQIHLLETRYEMLMARRLHGTSAVEHLAGLGFLGPDVVCAHSVWLTARDIARYAETGVVAVHNPASNLRLSSGIAPVRRMVEQGVHVAFGGDGLAFADDNDLLADLRLADQLQRLPGIRAERIPTLTWLAMATRAGARAMGLAGRVGELAPGRWADLTLIRKDRIMAPYVQPDIPVEDVLLWRGRADDVDTVLVGGRTVVERGEVLTIDRERLGAQLAADARAAFTPPSGADESRRLAAALEEEVVELLAGWDGADADPGYWYNTT